MGKFFLPDLRSNTYSTEKLNIFIYIIKTVFSQSMLLISISNIIKILKFNL